MFNQALLLTPHHELAYCGPPHLATPYFEQAGFRRLPAENPADWLMDIVSGRAVHEDASGHYGAAGQAEGLPALWRECGEGWIAKVGASCLVALRWVPAPATFGCLLLSYCLYKAFISVQQGRICYVMWPS